MVFNSRVEIPQSKSHGQIMHKELDKQPVSCVSAARCTGDL